MLQVKNITKYYGQNKAVDNLSFTVKNGEIFGLLGENGAGKTTTFRIIMGLLEANSGEVMLDSQKINYDLTDKIGFVTEERSLLGNMTVKEQIIFYGSLKGMTEEDILKELINWLKRFEIETYLDRKIKELSKGNQQKIQFISAVINHPKLLILDEPFTGLDPINVNLLKNAILELKKDGCSIIFSSHQMEHIEQFCEKLIILVKGKIIVEGYLDDIKKDYHKKNILIKGDIDPQKIEKINGVTQILKRPFEYEIKIDNDIVAKDVFKAIKDCDISKFDITEPTLNEIFIEKVGEHNEK